MNDAKQKSWREVFKVHAGADVLPMMSEPELQDLAADIKQNGLKLPILRWRDDAGIVWLIDGRNRAAAAQMAGLSLDEDLPCKWFTGSSEDVIPTIMALNLKRRHLAYDQRVAIAAELARLMAEEGKKLRKSHLKHQENIVVPPSAPRSRAVEQAAKKLDVGKTAVAEVIAAEKAKPGTIGKLKAGELKVEQVRKPKAASADGDPVAAILRTAIDVLDADQIGRLILWLKKHLKSLRGDSGIPDPRHTPIRSLILRLHAEKFNVKGQWDASEAKALSRLLSANPSWTEAELACMVRNHFASEGMTPQRPRVWLPRLGDYAAGPLDRYGKLREARGVGRKQQEHAAWAEREIAIANAIERGQKVN